MIQFHLISSLCHGQLLIFSPKGISSNLRHTYVSTLNRFIRIQHFQMLPLALTGNFHTLGRFSDERGMSELLLPGEGLLEKGSGRNFVLQDLLVVFTLPETSIAPENRPSQKETHLPTPVFQVRTVSFRATSQKDGFL